jgi:hypothetical protein
MLAPRFGAQKHESISERTWVSSDNAAPRDSFDDATFLANIIYWWREVRRQRMMGVSKPTFASLNRPTEKE